jgi:hypothetical protein
LPAFRLLPVTGSFALPPDQRRVPCPKCVAEVLGIRPTTTASHVRNLREAGLLTKTGRGITGAHMTPRDAAHLLIAANCSQDVQDSVETVRRYWKLPNIGGAVMEESFPALAALGHQHSFADALAALLGSESIRFLDADRASTVTVTFKHPIRYRPPLVHSSAPITWPIVDHAWPTQRQ